MEWLTGPLAETHAASSPTTLEPAETLPPASAPPPLTPCLFRGLHVYQGALQHVRTVADRRAAVFAQSVATAARARQLLEGAGIAVPIVTGAGTGTFLYEIEGGQHTEVQPGSYVFMDGDYADNETDGGADGRGVYEPSLWVHATVCSVTVAADRAVVDAGMKAVCLLSGPPRLTVQDEAFGFGARPAEGVVYECGGDEHGILSGPGVRGLALKVGDTVRLLPSHIDPTVNMHCHYVLIEESTLAHEEGPAVEGVWAIDGRSPGM